MKVSVLVTITLLCGVTHAADETMPDAGAYRARMMANRQLDGRHGYGEVFCWHAAYAAESFLDAWEAYRDPKWLAEAAVYYDWYLTKLRKDPDGYEGWIGNFVRTGGKGAPLQTDSVVGDAILCKPLVRWAEIVLADPQLKAQFGIKAKRYITLATRICWEKCNRRGQYYECAAGWGSYRQPDRLIDAKTWKWVAKPGHRISENLNKHYQIGVVLLRLWRLTGNEAYKTRVLKVFGRAKAMWRYVRDEDRVVWNFWMPHGPYDIEGRAPRSWVGVHPSRAGYQAGEAANWVEVYDSGLVFDRAGLERIIRTNIWMSKAGWRSADGSSKAGRLWPALARFDATLRRLYEKQLATRRGPAGMIAQAHFRTVTMKRLGWKRLHAADAKKVETVTPPLQDGRRLTMALVIPNTVETVNNAKVRFVTQARRKGETLTIELLDEAGTQILGTLHTQKLTAASEYLAPRWDGTNPKTGRKDLGRYSIRWRLGNETRVEPVWVVKGERREHTGPPALKPGETVRADFEGKPGARWRIDGAVPSDEQAHGGVRSLKLARGNVAQLVLAEDDLPVRVEMWVYDAGMRLGRSTKNGGGWGVRTADGDKFCIRQCWRRYLKGDADVAWFNTGENQWFTPHPAGVGRKTGWSKWVFDFTNPKAATITCNGRAVKRLTAKYTPKGVASVYLLGGPAGAIYVDDLTVTYPAK
jgi:hypothetical protein